MTVIQTTDKRLRCVYLRPGWKVDQEKPSEWKRIFWAVRGYPSLIDSSDGLDKLMHLFGILIIGLSLVTNLCMAFGLLAVYVSYRVARGGRGTATYAAIVFTIVVLGYVVTFSHKSASILLIGWLAYTHILVELKKPPRPPASLGENLQRFDGYTIPETGMLPHRQARKSSMVPMLWQLSDEELRKMLETSNNKEKPPPVWAPAKRSVDRDTNGRIWRRINPFFANLYPQWDFPTALVNIVLSARRRQISFMNPDEEFVDFDVSEGAAGAQSSL